MAFGDKSVYPKPAVSSTAAYFLETSITLVAVLAVAALILFGARRFGVGVPTGPLKLLGRLPLDARRAIYLVHVGPHILVVGASEGGLVKLAELPFGELSEATAACSKGSFSEVLARMTATPSRLSPF